MRVPPATVAALCRAEEYWRRHGRTPWRRCGRVRGACRRTLRSSVDGCRNGGMLLAHIRFENGNGYGRSGRVVCECELCVMRQSRAERMQMWAGRVFGESMCECVSRGVAMKATEDCTTGVLWTEVNEGIDMKVRSLYILKVRIWYAEEEGLALALALEGMGNMMMMIVAGCDWDWIVYPRHHKKQCPIRPFKSPNP